MFHTLSSCEREEGGGRRGREREGRLKERWKDRRQRGGDREGEWGGEREGDERESERERKIGKIDGGRERGIVKQFNIIQFHSLTISLDRLRT